MLGGKYYCLSIFVLKNKPQKKKKRKEKKERKKINLSEVKEFAQSQGASKWEEMGLSLQTPHS